MAGVGLDGAAEWLRVAWRWAAPLSGVQLLAVAVGFAVVASRLRPVARHAHAARGLPGQRARSTPLPDFFARYGRKAGLILALICLYRLSDFVLNIMNPFYSTSGSR